MPDVLWGSNEISKLPALLENVSAERVMVVTGQTVAQSEAFQRVIASLGDRLAGVFNSVKAHVPRQSVEAGAALAKSLHADALVSIGGGSAIDTTKAINMLLSEGNDYARLRQRLDEHSEVATPNMPGKKLLHVAIPTTLSAAECTGIAGITMENGQGKYLFSSPSLAPQYIIYDPTVTLDTPDELWFTTALRALDHAIERSYSLDTTPENDAMCMEAIQLVFNWLPINLKKRDDQESRLMLMRAAFLSMSGKSTTCLSHAIGHQLGPRYKNPRFDSTAVTQPTVMAFNRPNSAAKQKEMAIAMGLNVSELSNNEAAIKAEEAVNNLIQSVFDAGIAFPMRLRDTGIAENALEEIAVAVWQSPRLKANPRPINSQDEILQLLKEMW
jgi:alcohol dehydrogenase class IV